jgi:hypothetical protein
MLVGAVGIEPTTPLALIEVPVSTMGIDHKKDICTGCSSDALRALFIDAIYQSGMTKY